MAGKFPNKRRDTSGPKMSDRTAKVKSRLADAEKRAAAGDLAGAAAFAKAALAIQRKGAGTQQSLQRVARVANTYSRAAGLGGVKAGRIQQKSKPAGGGSGGTKSGPTETKRDDKKAPSYVGGAGTRKKDYQTGEGMTSRPRPKPGVNKWSAVDARVAAMRANAPSRTSGKAPSQSGLGSGRNMTTEAKIAAVRRGIVARKAALNAAKRRKASQAEQARLERQLQELQRQLKAL